MKMIKNKLMLFLMILPPASAYSQIVDADAFKTIDNPIYSCACSTNSPDNMVWSKEVGSTSIPEIASNCHDLEGKFIQLGSRKHVEGYVALLSCEPRVISKQRLEMPKAEPVQTQSSAPKVHCYEPMTEEQYAALNKSNHDWAEWYRKCREDKEAEKQAEKDKRERNVGR